MNTNVSRPLGSLAEESRGYLASLADIDDKTPCYIFSCDLIDNTVDGWATVDMKTPWQIHINNRAQERRACGLTVDASNRYFVFRCRNKFQIYLVAQFLQAPLGSEFENQCLMEFLNVGGHLMLAFRHHHGNTFTARNIRN
jgi:hypothetical protein